MLARVKGWARWLAQHQVLCLILFCSFVARLFLADWKSYWYDEILSVATYGSDHATLASALKSLAVHSAHPPLYHTILYYWMQVFGTQEVATRTLSNLYITGATLCLYLLALRLFGRRVAIASALLFAFSYTATFSENGQFLRCHEAALAEPDDDAEQAAIAIAIFETLQASGAENLEELLSGEHDEHAHKLGERLATIPKVSKN